MGGEALMFEVYTQLLLGAEKNQREKQQLVWQRFIIIYRERVSESDHLLHARPAAETRRVIYFKSIFFPALPRQLACSVFKSAAGLLSRSFEFMFARL